MSFLSEKKNLTDSYYFYGALSRGVDSGNEEKDGKDPWAGIKIVPTSKFVDGRFYKLSYNFKIPSSVEGPDITKLIGGHCASFSETTLTIKNPDGTKSYVLNKDTLAYEFETNTNYTIEFSGIYRTNSEDGNPYLFI
jgi:hypothetical protein